MWPATLRALRELTRLALAALVLVVGLGGAVATGLPGQPTALDLPARPVTATVVARSAVEPSQTTDEATTRQQRIAAQQPATGPARADLADTRPAPAPAVPADLVTAQVAAGAGEPTRRGPPAA